MAQEVTKPEFSSPILQGAVPVGRGDLLVVRMRNTLAAATFQARGRITLLDGSITEVTLDAVPDSDGTEIIFTTRLVPGFLTTVHVYSVSGTPAWGESWADVGVRLGSLSDQADMLILAQDYITDRESITWPVGSEYDRPEMMSPDSDGKTDQLTDSSAYDVQTYTPQSFANKALLHNEGPDPVVVTLSGATPVAFTTGFRVGPGQILEPPIQGKTIPFVKSLGSGSDSYTLNVWTWVVA